jgi:hypothetical protein
MLKTLAFFGTILVIVALITRFGNDPKNVAPRTLDAGFNAMTNIFRGVFRG